LALENARYSQVATGAQLPTYALVDAEFERFQTQHCLQTRHLFVRPLLLPTKWRRQTV